MPEVVYPTPDEKGNPRTWDKVFPIWQSKDDQLEWRVVNYILEAIAMNNRFGPHTIEELKPELLARVKRSIGEELDRAGIENLKAREDAFVQLGAYVFYVDKVFENLGGAYRAHKS